MTLENTVQVITVVVAVYGALLSTYVFATQLIEKRKRITVSLSMGFLTFGSRLSESQLLLQAANVGHRTVTLSAWCVRTPGDEQILMPVGNSQPSFPCELADGKAATCWLEAKEVARIRREKGNIGSVRLVGEVRDATGKRFKSKPITFRLTEWL